MTEPDNVNLDVLRARWWLESNGQGEPPPSRRKAEGPIIGETEISILAHLCDYGYLTTREIAEDLGIRPEDARLALNPLLQRKRVACKRGDDEWYWYATEAGRRWFPDERPSVKLIPIQRQCGRKSAANCTDAAREKRHTVPNRDDYLVTIQRWIPRHRVPLESKPCYLMGGQDAETGDLVPVSVVEERTDRSVTVNDRRAPQVIAMYRAGMGREEIADAIHMDGGRVAQIVREAGIQRTCWQQIQLNRKRRSAAD